VSVYSDEQQVRVDSGPSPFPGSHRCAFGKAARRAQTLQVDSSWVTVVMSGLESIGQYICITAKM
jgi:hypothetical protein